jgi:hypothetical protein
LFKRIVELNAETILTVPKMIVPSLALFSPSIPTPFPLKRSVEKKTTALIPDNYCTILKIQPIVKTLMKIGENMSLRVTSPVFSSSSLF